MLGRRDVALVMRLVPRRVCCGVVWGVRIATVAAVPTSTWRLAAATAQVEEVKRGGYAVFASTVRRAARCSGEELEEK